jgi:hypothetical protein
MGPFPSLNGSFSKTSSEIPIHGMKSDEIRTPVQMV